jgi:hypothetical protein
MAVAEAFGEVQTAAHRYRQEIGAALVVTSTHAGEGDALLDRVGRVAATAG